jgi:hypothetical protein
MHFGVVFVDQFEVPKTMLLPIFPSLFEATWRPSGVFLIEIIMLDVEYVSQIHRTTLSNGRLSSLDLGSSHPYHLNWHVRGMLSLMSVYLVRKFCSHLNFLHLHVCQQCETKLTLWLGMH